jgi:hypothetical protein
MNDRAFLLRPILNHTHIVTLDGAVLQNEAQASVIVPTRSMLDLL